MEQVRALPARGVRCRDAVDQFLSTIQSSNTRRGYVVALIPIVRDLGVDSEVGVLGAGLSAAAVPLCEKVL
ncbi:hypothetical protein [Nocardia testacea]|uniref:hypothetical protein n=1 Tax=Nocardia testacea TaxID=248551 RepID=UPI003A868C6E